MNAKQFLQHFYNQRHFKSLLESLSSDKKVHCNGVIGTAHAIIVAGIFENTQKNILAIAQDWDEANFLKQDIDGLIGENKTLLINASFQKAFHTNLPDNHAIQQRTEVFNKILKSNNPKIIIASPESILEMVVDKDTFKKNRLEIAVNETLDLDFMIEFLNEYGFEREDFVYEPGHFSIRGGIIDIYSFATEYPYRIELNGRTIESIRAFNTNTQLSLSKLQYASIVPNLENQNIESTLISAWNYIKDDTIIIANQWTAILNNINIGLQNAIDIFVNNEAKNPAFIYDSIDFFKQKILVHQLVEISKSNGLEINRSIDFNLIPQPSFNTNFPLMIQHFKENTSANISNLVFSDSNKQIERLMAIFEDLDDSIQFLPIYQSISSGFLDVESKVACYTEHQLFNKFYTYKTKHKFTRNQALTLKELKDLKPGDWIVHIDHGVGKFEGLQKIEMAGTMQEAVRISYKNNDLLYVNITSLHKISKFVGKDGQEPVLNKLGSDTWQKLKTKTKAKVKDIARDLIKLYAKRRAQKGFAFSPDSYMQIELEASFVYEDTPDQAKVTDDIKADMQQDYPMDRLVCGDVGFGKTEVAIRAAFKAAVDGKQIAILVPTTILAQQHFRTFRNRLKDFPISVDYINRFKSQKQQKETLNKLANGKLDIIIGTHKLLGKDIKFKDLGLLVIDEEQKFGVAAKDRLKQLRVNVDTLTLTATPIPRTLHFSLMGARDLSVINTPPNNRQPVHTELGVFNKEFIKNIINKEIHRGGQVFFVHNRVKDIQQIAHIIEEVCPDAKVCVGHGQMPGDELEDIMAQFIEGEYDVLVATTIIESGLDISNANTIIINNAHFFGLSDLHQMRGRVGRSNRKAYCYLLSPPIHTLTDDAKRRLKAIEEFSDLGSGFNVAMRDLDIRGAGNLLGAEQSGFISDIGIETYHKILDEAVRELKKEEFSDMFQDIKLDTPRDCQIETDVDIMIPDAYIRNIAERLSIYTELSKIENEPKLSEYALQVEDRFGKIPASFSSLMDMIRLKWIAKKLGLEKIIFKNGVINGWFLNEDDFYQSEMFGHVLDFVKENTEISALKQNKDNLLLNIKIGKKSIQTALNTLMQISNKTAEYKI